MAVQRATTCFLWLALVGTVALVITLAGSLLPLAAVVALALAL